MRSDGATKGPKALAREIIQHSNREAVAELVQALGHSERRIKSDCIKVHYECDSPTNRAEARTMLAMRLFLSGLVLIVLFALGHLAGFLQAARAARQDPQLAEATRAMRAYKVNLLGFQPSLLDFREYFSLNFSILLLFAGALGFLALSIAPDQMVAVRKLSLAYAIAMVLLLATSAYFSILQGIVACLLIGVVFGLAWWTA